MNTFSTIVDNILAFGGDVILSFFIYGFVGSMIGLIWSVLLVKRFNRRGAFDRPNKVWTYLVSLNKIYLPIVSMIFCGTMCGTYGVNSTVNNEIERNITIVAEKLDLNKINWAYIEQHLQSQRTLEEGLTMELSKSNGHYHENAIIAKAMLEEFNYPQEIDVLVEKIRSVDLSIFRQGASFGLSYYASDYIDGIFWMAYRYLFVLLCVLFLKLPVLELVLYLIFSRIFGHSKKVYSPSYVTQ